VKIYTRSGDSGDTGLFDGTRVLKSDARVAAYGDLDELNAWVGLVIASLDDDDLAPKLLQIQRDLFAIGSRLADPSHRIAGRVTKAAVSADDVARLEGWIDALDGELSLLRRFILAGGSPAGAALHVARTVCRRAERETITLARDEPIGEHVLPYLNRLSDALFVMARYENHERGVDEPLWQPGL